MNDKSPVGSSTSGVKLSTPSASTDTPAGAPERTTVVPSSGPPPKVRSLASRSRRRSSPAVMLAMSGAARGDLARTLTVTRASLDTTPAEFATV